MVFAVLSFLPTFTAAQCPDASGPAPDPAVCPWSTNLVHAQLGTTGCWITAYYCYRECHGYGAQVWVYKVVPDAGTGCGSFSPQDIIDSGRSKALNDALQYLTSIPDCLSGTTQAIESYCPSCWSGHLQAETQIQYLGCSAVSCFCEKVCDVCKISDHVYRVDNCRPIGNPGCDCPPWPGSWNLDECYSIGCN